MAGKEVSVNIREHGIIVDKDKQKVKCNYCDKVVSGSTRLKCHLGGIRGDVAPCEQVPENVKEEIRKVLLEKKMGNLSKEVGELEHPDLPLIRNGPHQSNGTRNGSSSNTGSPNTKRVKVEPGSENNGPLFVGRGSKSIDFPSRRFEFQAAVDGNGDPSLHTKRCISKFFYETGFEFHADMIPSFRRMINSISAVGSDKPGDMIPTCQELKGWILQNELKEMQDYVQDIRSSWARTGCSVLLDGWNDEKGRELVNVIVDCPKGPIYLHSFDISAFVGDINAMNLFIDKVLEEVGINDVVQVISYSASEFMMAFGEQLTDRHRTIFWAVSASVCIEMMLEKIGKMNFIKNTVDKAKKITKFICNRGLLLKLLRTHIHGRDLVKPSKIRSIASFMTLENIMLESDNLKKMFTSSEWKTSTWACTKEGKRIKDLVADCSFWCDVRKVLSATIPLSRVLELINDRDKQRLGYIYETLDQAKETIKGELENKKSTYLPFWEIIDNFWNNYLHNPLHSAGYYLNPSLFYSDDFLADPEVISGLLCCIVRLAEDRRAQDLITLQLDAYREPKGDFHNGSGISRRSDISPAIWWSKYGENYPDLQRFAIRILSQTCDGASSFALNRSLAEKMLREGMNCLEQQRLCDLTFVHYNMQLRNMESTENVAVDEIDPMDDWIVDNAQEAGSRNDNLTWMNLDGGDMITGGPSSVCPKEEPN